MGLQIAKDCSSFSVTVITFDLYTYSHIGGGKGGPLFIAASPCTFIQN